MLLITSGPVVSVICDIVRHTCWLLQVRHNYSFKSHRLSAVMDKCPLWLSSDIATRPWEMIMWHPAVSPSIHHLVITRLSLSPSHIITETRHVFLKTRTVTKNETKKKEKEMVTT